MQDHLQQTLVISQMRSQKTLTEQAVSKTQGNAAHEAMEAATQAREWQAEPRRLFWLKNAEKPTEADTRYSDAIEDTHEKTEALEQHVKTVTVRAESLATTEANFFRTILDR